MVQFLQQQGLNQTQIADHPLVRSDRGTVRKITRREHPLQQSERKKRETESTLISAYIPYIKERLEKYPQLSAIRIHEEITDMGYTGSIRTTRRGVAALRQPREKRAYKPFETLPGQQMQVDWATCNVDWPGGSRQTMYAFIAVLGYSRHVYVEHTTSMDMNTVLACHHRAFIHFKGVPQEVVYDNARTVTEERVGSIVRFQQELLAFSKHYGYRPHACWVLDPESKVKVESSVRYIQDNFFYGREFENMQHLNEEAIIWCQRVARRVHGTTRKIPYECWKEEQAYLRILPELPYMPSNMQVRKADKTGLISVEGNRYSVPWAYQNHNIRVVDRGEIFDVYSLEGEWLTAHTKAKEKTKPIILDDHYKDRPRGSIYRKQRSLQTKFEGLGERAKEFAIGLSLDREGGSLRDQMESILRLTEIYPKDEVYEALERCLQAEQEKWTYQAFLLHLLEEEIESRNQTVERKRMRAAKFPSEKTIEDFDFTFQHSLSREKIMRLSTLEFIEKRENVMMIGPAGVGKAHLAIALGREAVTAGYTVLFRTAQQLVEELYASLADGTVAKRIQSYLRNDLFIIEEFGYLPMDETASNHLFQVVSHLYEQKSIIVTGNLSFREWPTAFSSEAIAVATLDRLLHHSHRLVFNGDSYRLKGKKAAN